METYDIDPSVSQQMFGCDIEKFANRIVDCGQELLGINGDGGKSKEDIRQALNRAKFLLAEIQDGNMIAVVER
jgi:hypothetical protein